jgi:outer membrane receptor protein involved in Fe transport
MYSRTLFTATCISTLVSVSTLFSLTSSATADELETVTVDADFRPTTLEDSTVSVSVVDEKTVEERGAKHIEEILNIAPNVNSASGASRARYFQIRGIGERSQFVTPINPSVGLYIDGIDFSRSGASATLFDVDQVEIIRGPQGTKYGANALAGIINIKTKEPSNEREGKIEVGFGSFNQKSLGIAAGGPLIKNKLLGRFSLHSNQSDGYITNTFLNRDDTNNIDELTARGHLKWLASDDLTVDLKVLHLDIDNGYDAFNFDNNFSTESDEPGKDKQKTNAFSIDTLWDANEKVTLETSVSFSDSDLEYSYDEDWSYVGQFDPSLFPYSSFDQYLRNRKNTSLDVRILSNEEGRIFNDKTDWVIGLYHSKKTEDLQREYTFLTTDFFSQYDTKNTALYGQLDTQINDKLKVITGLRLEQWDADYSDTENINIKTDEVLHGGKLGFEYQLNENHLTHASVSRGYKAGGVNNERPLPPGADIDFDTEFLWNFEVGLNSSFFDDKLTTRVSAFYAKRKDLQTKKSFVKPRGDGSSSFTDYIDNSSEGYNYGLETELDWKLSDKWRIKSSLGLLDTQFLQDTDTGTIKREQAHAPNYQYSLGTEYDISPKLTAGINLEGKDGFFFSDRHNAKTDSYKLLNANLSYKHKDWTTTLWGRNILDKDYDVRGFGSFGNNPGNGYAVETYTQKGEPRTVGLTVSLDF